LLAIPFVQNGAVQAWEFRGFSIGIGVGFDPELLNLGKPGHFGFVGMREHAIYIVSRLLLKTFSRQLDMPHAEGAEQNDFQVRHDQMAYELFRLKTGEVIAEFRGGARGFDLVCSSDAVTHVIPEGH
jgi:hypothetical protein